MLPYPPEAVVTVSLLPPLLLPSLDLSGSSGWHPVGRKPALALQAEWEGAATL